MMSYESQPCGPDHWDLAKTLTWGGAALSLVGLALSKNSKLRGNLAGLATGLSAMGTIVHVKTPPRCQTCCERSRDDGTFWICPNGHGIIGRSGRGHT